MAVNNITFESGYIVLHRDSGGSTKYPIASVLRALDIPTGLTYAQVGAVSTLANMFAVLIRTLIDRDILNESFMENGDYDLAAIVQSIEDMGGSFVEPDISAT